MQRNSPSTTEKVRPVVDDLRPEGDADLVQCDDVAHASPASVGRGGRSAPGAKADSSRTDYGLGVNCRKVKNGRLGITGRLSLARSRGGETPHGSFTIRAEFLAPANRAPASPPDSGARRGAQRLARRGPPLHQPGGGVQDARRDRGRNRRAAVRARQQPPRGSRRSASWCCIRPSASSPSSRA